tara:strand:+ start:484 stop:744 length:261 start_codon:yes stop_codon:yes gene_type:complete
MYEKKRWKVLRFLGSAIPILLVVYVLSIGPLVAIVYDSGGKSYYPQSENFLVSFYSPLTWACDQNAYVGQALISYIKFCRGTEIED